jgi:hypothetical protein
LLFSAGAGAADNVGAQENIALGMAIAGAQNITGTVIYMTLTAKKSELYGKGEKKEA